MRPRLSPSTTSPSSRNGAPRQRIAPSTSPAATSARIRVDETVSPSTSTSGTTLVSNSEWERSICGSPFAFFAEAEVLAHRDGRRAQRLDQDPRAELLGLDPAELLIERDHHHLRDAEALDHVALDLERHDQLRRRLRVDDAQRVRFEGEHGVGALDDLAMADVNAVEGADRDPARARLGLAQRGDGDAHRTELWQLSDRGARRAKRRCAAVEAPLTIAEPEGRSGGDGSYFSSVRRRSASASAIGACSSASSTENGPIAVRRSSVQ